MLRMKLKLRMQNVSLKLNNKDLSFYDLSTRVSIFKQTSNICQRLNKTYHRIVGMAPKSGNSGNETAVWWRMYWPRVHTDIKKTKTVRKPF